MPFRDFVLTTTAALAIRDSRYSTTITIKRIKKMTAEEQDILNLFIYSVDELLDSNFLNQVEKKGSCSPKLFPMLFQFA
jgi:hypothetical protein